MKLLIIISTIAAGITTIIVLLRHLLKFLWGNRMESKELYEAREQLERAFNKVYLIYREIKDKSPSFGKEIFIEGRNRLYKANEQLYNELEGPRAAASKLDGYLTKTYRKLISRVFNYCEHLYAIKDVDLKTEQKIRQRDNEERLDKQFLEARDAIAEFRQARLAAYALRQLKSAFYRNWDKLRARLPFK